MPKGSYLGDFEQLVLLALMRLGPRAYGMTVRRELEETADRRVSLGAIYATLDRLEGKGLVTSHLGDPVNERRGRAKRFFKVRGPGVEALQIFSGLVGPDAPGRLRTGPDGGGDVVSEPVTSERGLGPEFPGPCGRTVLRLLLPAGRREEFVGDLIEEAETDVLPRRGRNAALRWFWWQAATSASPMHTRRCAREIGMHRQRWIVVVAILIAGTVMALDSGAAELPRALLGLVAVALFIPAAAGLLSGNLRIHAAAALTSTVLLIVARLMSGVELRWYAIPWILFVLLVMNWGYEHRKLISGGDDGSAGPRPAI